MYFCTHWDDRIPSLGFRGLDASKLAEYWENAVQSWDAVDIGCYPEAFAAARKCDYNKLAQLIPKLCLVAVRVLSLALVPHVLYRSRWSVKTTQFATNCPLLPWYLLRTCLLRLPLPNRPWRPTMYQSSTFRP